MGTESKAQRIRLVENSVERTARILATEHDIHVVWEPGVCQTNGRVITLPTLPPEASDSLIEAIQGFLDHEAAHILFSDFKAVPKDITKEQHTCINVVEDVRIERKMCDFYPGSSYNLTKANEWCVEQHTKLWDSYNQFKRAIIAYFQIRRYSDKTDFWKNVVDQTTKDLVTECLKFNDPLNVTKDAVKVGLEVYEILKQFAEEEQKQREQAEQESAAASASGSKGKGKDSQDVGNQQPTTIGELLSQAIKTQVADAFAKMKKSGVGGYQHDLLNDHTYVVYTTKYDTIAKMPDSNLENNGKRLKRLRDEAQLITGVIRTKLVNTLRARTKRKWMGGKEDGKLDTRKLARAGIGVTSGIYKKQSEKIALDTAVVLAIDHSGSMSGRKLELAGEAAIVIGDVLNTLKVPFMVYGYSTEYGREHPRTPELYARWNSLWIRHYCDFNEPWEKGAIRLAGAATNEMNNTLDAESVKYGMRQLLLRKEKRKILLVLNDGQPYPGYGHTGRCQQHLKDVVDAAEQHGIEVVAFGIQDRAVEKYYPNHVVINNLDDLVKEPLKILDSILRKGMTGR